MVKNFSDPFDRFLSVSATAETALLLLSTLLQTEADTDGPRVHRMPYFRWEHRVPESTKQNVQRALDGLTASPVNDLSLEVVKVGVFMRLYGGRGTDAIKLDELVNQGVSKETPAEVLFELGNIYRALTNWQTLQTIAETTLNHQPAGSWQRHVTADWLILARYRQLLKKLDAGKLTDTDLRAFKESAQFCTEALGNETKNTIFYQSLIAMLEGDIDGALDLLLMAQSLPGKLIILFERMEFFTNPEKLKAMPDTLVQNLVKNLTDHTPHQEGEAGMLLVSLDKVYFAQYGETFLTSFGQQNPDGLVHLHCVDFRPDSTRITELERAANIRINFTVDTPPDDVQEKHLFNGYCAGARYLFLHHYLTMYRRITVSDVDGVITRDLQDVWRDNCGAILLSSQLINPARRNTRLLWEAIAAGSFAISDTPANRRFTNRLANSLADQLTLCRDRKTKLFYTDQVSLFLAYMASKNECTFKPLNRLFSQKQGWQLDGATDAKIAFQKAANKQKSEQVN